MAICRFTTQSMFMTDFTNLINKPYMKGRRIQGRKRSSEVGVHIAKYTLRLRRQECVNACHHGFMQNSVEVQFEWEVHTSYMSARTFPCTTFTQHSSTAVNESIMPRPSIPLDRLINHDIHRWLSPNVSLSLLPIENSSQLELVWKLVVV